MGVTWNGVTWNGVTWNGVTWNGVNGGEEARERQIIPRGTISIPFGAGFTHAGTEVDRIGYLVREGAWWEGASRVCGVTGLTGRGRSGFR